MLSHWYVYQSLYLTLVFLLVTFILVIAHVSSAIHLVCYILQPSITKQVTTNIICKP
jgi:hypothetical protein